MRWVPPGFSFCLSVRQAQRQLVGFRSKGDKLDEAVAVKAQFVGELDLEMTSPDTSQSRRRSSVYGQNTGSRSGTHNTPSIQASLSLSDETPPFNSQGCGGHHLWHSSSRRLEGFVMSMECPKHPYHLCNGRLCFGVMDEVHFVGTSAGTGDANRV